MYKIPLFYTNIKTINGLTYLMLKSGMDYLSVLNLNSQCQHKISKYLDSAYKGKFTTSTLFLVFDSTYI